MSGKIPPVVDVPVDDDVIEYWAECEIGGSGPLGLMRTLRSMARELRVLRAQERLRELEERS